MKRSSRAPLVSLPLLSGHLATTRPVGANALSQDVITAIRLSLARECRPMRDNQVRALGFSISAVARNLNGNCRTASLLTELRRSLGVPYVSTELAVARGFVSSSRASFETQVKSAPSYRMYAGAVADFIGEVYWRVWPASYNAPRKPRTQKVLLQTTKPALSENVRARMRELIASLGGYATLSATAGVSASALRSIVQGSCDPKISSLIRIAHAANMPLNQLIGEA